MTNEHLTREQFVYFVRAARQGVVATVDRDGHPAAALVEIGVLGDGDLLFQTKAGARKAANLFHHDRVALVIGWDPVSLQIEGAAELLMGIELDALAPLYAEQHPQRPAMSEAFNLYRVRPEWLRYCEHRPGRPPITSEGLWA